MWNKNRSPARHRKTGQAKVSSKSARKTRTKTRKPKYVSLKLELASPSKKPETPQRTATKMPHKQQLTLFPLHPEHAVHDRDMQDDQAANEVAFLFETSVEDTSITLQGLLGNTATTTTTTATSDESSPLSPTHSLSCVSRGNEESENMSASSLLLRSAMRSKERDVSTERWVSYREVVKKEQEEQSSCCGEFHRDQKGRVGLKLDYEQILNAWSNKGSLYIEGASPQTVPDLHDSSSVLIEGMGYCGNLWRVPEMDSMRIMKKVGAEEEWRSLELREASVLRYKEKKQSRLFSKRIRYEVRKRNAEKRPRMKGRFVKKSRQILDMEVATKKQHHLYLQSILD